MAVSRFDRRPPERDPARINERIRVSEVRLIDEEDEQAGVMPTPDALSYARDWDLDLVEMAPNSKPPVERFLKQHDKVKVTIMFRDREATHPERTRMLLDRLFEDVSELAVVEQEPLQEGRNLHMLLAPARGATEKPQEAAAG